MPESIPPYVFPDRKPDAYDSDRAGMVWWVSGPTHTDGRGWDWAHRYAVELVDGDIWVPIHLLHRAPIARLVDRSAALRERAAEKVRTE